MKNKTIPGIATIGFTQLLFLLLKITNLIHWKWYWVLSPSWIGFLFIVLAAVVFIFFMSGINMEDDYDHGE